MSIAQTERAVAATAGQASEERKAVVTIEGADKVFADGTRALAPVDLAIAEGEFVSLLGPSGCGKSTLLKMVANLLQPSEGRIAWWGDSFDKVGGKGRNLVFVFQDATLMPWLRVRSNVRLPLDLAGMSRREADRKVDEALELVGLSRFEGHYPRQLSGGMQMRTSIARALVTEPNLLLMDEPFGALDEITRNRLDQDLLDLWWKRKLTVVFVTHSIYEAVFLSTRVVVMSAQPGRILRDIAIDAPYPRDENFRVSDEFTAYARELQGLLADASHGRDAAGGQSNV